MELSGYIEMKIPLATFYTIHIVLQLYISKIEVSKN